MAWLPSKKRKGLGFRKGPADARDHDFDRLGLASPTGSTVSLQSYAKVLDQGPSNTCVGHAYASALFIREGYVGLEQRDVSVLYPYFWSRWVHGGHRRDNGTFGRTMAEGARRFGVCDDEYWSFSPLGIKVNRAPSISARSHAYPRVGAKYVTILDPYREARHRSIQAGLEHGYPTMMGITVSRAFQRMDGDSIVPFRDFVLDPIGGHEMLIVAWDAERRLYMLQNSYGVGYRDGGFCWIDEETVDHAMELTIVHGWPRLLDAG